MESLHFFFAFFIDLAKHIGIGDNFELLISNLNSKTQYWFKILRKNATFLPFQSLFLAQHSLKNLLPWQQ